jgi:hypothetical protein
VSRSDRPRLDRYRAEAAPTIAEILAIQNNRAWQPWADLQPVADLRADRERALAVLVTLLDGDDMRFWGLPEALMRMPLPYSLDDAALLVAIAESKSSAPWRGLPRARAAVVAVEARSRAGDDVSELADRLAREVSRPRDAEEAEWTKLARRLRALSPPAASDKLDLSAIRADDPWSEHVRPRLKERFCDQGALFEHIAGATQSKPSRRWLNTAEELLTDEGRAMLRFLVQAAVEVQPSERGRAVYEGREYVSYQWLHDMSATVLRGALWACARIGDADWVAPSCAALIEKARRFEEIKVGNACFYCLGERADDQAVAVLGRVVAEVKDRRFLKPAQRALEHAAELRGVSAAQLREQLVPTFGLDHEGRGTVAVGPGEALLEVVPPAKVKVRYRVDGRERAGVPQALADADELVELKRTTSDLRKELTVQRTRLENLLADERSWALDEWRAHYVDHPLVQLFARRLIWRFGDRAAIPLDRDSYLSLDGQIDPPADGEVRLWHPLDSQPDEIAAWRALLRDHELQQPFKQAYREIYLVAPAEQQTEVYSNRFAAHIVRYPQVYALAKVRGWAIRALGPYDNNGGEQWRDFPEHGLRVRFWMEPADEMGGALIADLAATDQVRFTRLDEGEPLPLDGVPRIVFSEAMRDVDLFVGVASIAADPTWVDGGVDRFAAYWRENAFGELGESAKLRREVLAGLLPGLRIAGRLELEERYLRVRGNLHSYRIHLGSANILVEPHDRFLCIVPNRGPSMGKLFLPFEDERLSVILSKAFLLARDDEITDSTILQQLR